MDLLIAWRNIWRNPRRTLVVLTAITVGIWTLLFMTAFAKGFLQEMVDQAIANLTGHLQIHADGFIDDPGIDHLIHDPKALENQLSAVLPEGSRLTRRVRTNTVVNNSRHSYGCTLVGMDWDKETSVSFIGEASIEGEAPTGKDPHAILVGKALLERFETRIGHKLILMAQDTTGEIASRAFYIRGVYDAELESTEKQFLFVDEQSAQDFLKLKGAVSEYSIVLPDSDDTSSVQMKIRQSLGEHYEVHNWLELLPAIRAYVEMWDALYYIWIFVIFIAMGFGLVNTMIMAVYERIREFGLVRALGMRRRRIIKSVLYESIFLLFFGFLVGNTIGWLTIAAFSTHGIDLSSFAESSEYLGISRRIFPVLTLPDWIRSNSLVFALGLVVSLYPAIQAARFTPVKAIKHDN